MFFKMNLLICFCFCLFVKTFTNMLLVYVYTHIYIYMVYVCLNQWCVVLLLLVLNKQHEITRITIAFFERIQDIFKL